MNTGQTLITIGSLVLLSIIILNGNRFMNENDVLLNETRFKLETIALATSIIEEASQLPFDEVCWDSTVLEKKVNDFTFPQNLGADPGETNYATFDDFDDFHNYVKPETTKQNVYQISCRVGYVDYTNPNVEQSYRTYFKKLTVMITSSLSPDTLKMSYVYGYWYFN